MSSQEEDLDEGPSVDSQDPEQRIAARRKRIDRRREIQRRNAMGEDPDKKKEVKEEKSRSDVQTELSRQRLAKMEKQGVDLVSNVRVAGDAREVSRRNEEEEARRQRKERLEAEAKAGVERFEEITKKWEIALQKEIPQELYEMLQQQQRSCKAMIDEKNKLINDFSTELKMKDDAYVSHIRKQADDVNLLIERMEQQVKDLTKSYRNELGEIEQAFVTERAELLELHMKKWDANMKQRREKEEEHMRAREKRVEDNDRDLQILRKQDAEEYNDVKIKLEKDVQTLEQNLQTMKATFQLNQEKLEYNYQVLKKREEENTITKSQQKRKITRMQDSLTHIRQKLTKQEKQFKEENQQLTDDYKRVSEQFRDLQRKSKHFLQTDVQKFTDVWKMNEEECKELMERVLHLDHIIHEQQLGLKYEEPNLDFANNVGPITGDNYRPAVASAMQVAREVVLGGDKSDTKSLATTQLSPQTIKHVLELLCEESGFLVESKLKRLLKPLEPDEQTLMKLDAIFTALGIETEDDIQLLVQFFMQYRIGAEKSSVPKPDAEEDDAASQILDDEQAFGSEAGSQEDPEIARVTERDGSEKSFDSTAARDSLLHPNDVVRALRSFVEQHKTKRREKGDGGQFKIASLDDRDDSHDAEYWQKYGNILDERKGKVWQAVQDILHNYSELLSSRSELITETDSLRQQNSELRLLLHQYINSKVNAELEVPPTRILPLE